MDVLGAEATLRTGTLPDGSPDFSRLQRLFLFSRSDTIYAGSNQIQRNIIGERALGLPKEPPMTADPVPPPPAGRDLLAGKIVLVTAAAGTGIGYATARRCIEEGATVVLSDAHERRLGEAADELAEATGTRPVTLRVRRHRRGAGAGHGRRRRGRARRASTWWSTTPASAAPPTSST